MLNNKIKLLTYFMYVLCILSIAYCSMNYAVLINFNDMLLPKKKVLSFRFDVGCRERVPRVAHRNGLRTRNLFFVLLAVFGNAFLGLVVKMYSTLLTSSFRSIP